MVFGLPIGTVLLIVVVALLIYGATIKPAISDEELLEVEQILQGALQRRAEAYDPPAEHLSDEVLADWISDGRNGGDAA